MSALNIRALVNSEYELREAKVSIYSTKIIIVDFSKNVDANRDRREGGALTNAGIENLSGKKARGRISSYSSHLISSPSKRKD